MGCRVSEQLQAGPYDGDKCFFCGKSSHDKKGNDTPMGTAGYQRREQYAQQGPWRDACNDCAKKPYEQPKQFQQEEENAAF